MLARTLNLRSRLNVMTLINIRGKSSRKSRSIDPELVEAAKAAAESIGIYRICIPPPPTHTHGATHTHTHTDTLTLACWPQYIPPAFCPYRLSKFTCTTTD